MNLLQSLFLFYGDRPGQFIFARFQLASDFPALGLLLAPHLDGIFPVRISNPSEKFTGRDILHVRAWNEYPAPEILERIKEILGKILYGSEPYFALRRGNGYLAVVSFAPPLIPWVGLDRLTLPIRGEAVEAIDAYET